MRQVFDDVNSLCQIYSRLPNQKRDESLLHQCIDPRAAPMQAMKDVDMRDAARDGGPEARARLAAVQRAGCMAIRNICARSPGLRPQIAAVGAEKVTHARTQL